MSDKLRVTRTSALYHRSTARMALVPVAIASTVIGWFAIGPAVAIVMVGAGAVVVGLLWSGPRINDRLYAGPPAPAVLLSACAIVDGTSGRVEFDARSLRWVPYRRHALQPPISVSLAEVEMAELQQMPGIPRSCRVAFRFTSGGSSKMTIFRGCAVVETALEECAAGLP